VGAALSDVWIELVTKSWSEIRDARLRNAGRVLELTADELELGPEELVNLTQTTEQSTQVLFEVMEAAARTMDSNKIRALARALANGLRDDSAAIDREALVVRALSDIETMHLRVLSIVADQPNGRCTESHLVINEGIDRVVLGAVIETLKRHALLDSDDDFAGHFQRVLKESTVPLHDPTWALTPFGHLCLERLAS
jgi:hypothetical protein